jgi:hypothetical protein
VNAIWFVTFVSKYLNSVTFSDDVVFVIKLWFCPAFWWRDTIMCVPLESSPTSHLACYSATLFFFMLLILSSNILSSSPQTRGWCMPFNFNPSWLHIPKQIWKSMATKHLLVLDNSEQGMHQTDFYLCGLHYGFHIIIIHMLISLSIYYMGASSSLRIL